MAKDERLWMRFPIDMHRDPKVTRLSDAAFRVFFQMNGEARLEANDGVFTKEDAEFRWPAELLAELVKSHPTEPLVIASADAYRLRRYAKHQFTEADREELSRKRSEAGKAGAAAKHAAGKSQASAKQEDGKTWQAQAESESESDLHTDGLLTTVSPSSNETLHAAGRLTDFEAADLRTGIKGVLDIDATDAEIRALTVHLCSKAQEPVKNARKYVAGSLRNSELEISQWFTDHRQGATA